MKLPFQIEPKTFETVAVGTPETGILQVKKLGGLTVAEQRFIKNQSLPDVQKRVTKLARDIATRSGLSFVAVYDEFVSRINGVFNLLNIGDRVTVKNIKRLDGKTGLITEFVDNDTAVMLRLDDSLKPEKVDLVNVDKVSILDLGDCLSEIKDCQALLEESTQRRLLVYASAIARYRLSAMSDSMYVVDGFLEVVAAVLRDKLDPRVAVDLTQTIQRQLEESQEIFGIEAIAGQHPALVEALAEFAAKEESGWAKSKVPEAVTTTEEELGKS